MDDKQWRNWGGPLGVIALPLRKNLPFLKDYENQSKLYVDINCNQVFVLFSKTLL